MTKEIVNILMATYNGEKFLGEQLDSIILQTYRNWNLYIRDDGSSDSTLNIIKKYSNSDSRIHGVTDGLGNLKSCQNFSALMQVIKDEDAYIMFSDQDDVWLPNKIADTLCHMIGLEQECGTSTPLLVYTNFIYSSENLLPIKSKKKFDTTKVKELTFANLIAQNPIYGCTTMLNKKLLDWVDEIPAVAENHDYWVALVAGAFGKISYFNERTIVYRQHDVNVSGHYSNNRLLKRLKRILDKKNFSDVRSKMTMASQFRKIYSTRLKDNQARIIDDFIDLSGSKSLRLLWKNMRNGVRRQTFAQTTLFYFSIIFLKKCE